VASALMKLILIDSCIMCEGVIHLSGYVMPEDEVPGPSELMTDSDEEEEDKEEIEADEDSSPLGSNFYYWFYVCRLHCCLYRILACFL